MHKVKIATTILADHDDNPLPYFCRTNYFWGKKIETGVNDKEVDVNGEPSHKAFHTYKIEWYYYYTRMTWVQRTHTQDVGLKIISSGTWMMT